MPRRKPLRTYVDHFFSNWNEFDGPLSKKLRLATRNRFIATGLMQGCCGHHGEPGC
jgi:hypothetical protein